MNKTTLYMAIFLVILLVAIFAWTMIIPNWALVSVGSFSINSFDFSLSVSPTIGTVGRSQSANSSIIVTLTKGRTQNVQLYLFGCPSSTNCSLSRTSGNPSFASVLRVQTTSGTPLGANIITIIGIGGGLNRSKTYTLTVNTYCPDGVCESGETCSSCSQDCVCQSGYTCVNSTCQMRTCSDGTPYGLCSSNKPLYCDNGNLVNKCSSCGCNSGYICNTNANSCYANVSNTCPSGYSYDWTAPGFSTTGQIQTCIKREANVACSYLSSTACNRTTYLSIPVNTNLSAYGNDLLWIFDISDIGTNRYYSWRILDNGNVVRETYSTQVGFVTKLVDGSNNIAFVASSGINSTINVTVESFMSIQTCSDGTLYGHCSSTEPLYCSNGALINNCSQCGCQSGYNCLNNTCIQQCTCGNWTNGACGAGGCASVQRQQTRTCTPSGCDIASQCVNDSSCITNPDSCTDNDGGPVFTVKGTVSGYRSSQPYNYTDYCVGNLTLVEYYCSGTTPLNTTFNCYTNTTSHCYSGACA